MAERMLTPLNVLNVEDSPDDGELILPALGHSKYQVQWTRVWEREAYLRHLRPDLDVSLAEWRLPAFDRQQAFRAAWSEAATRDYRNERAGQAFDPQVVAAFERLE
jgi:response regulator RpfG family c-di-GMP phosphodiesterase